MKNETNITSNVTGNGNTVIINGKPSGRLFSTKRMVIIAMFSALSYVLMFLKFPIAYLGFLEFEFSDIPALVAGLAYGPLTAVIIELIKNLIKGLTSSFTGGVGEFANFVVSAAYMFAACGIFKRFKGKGKVITGFTVGTIAMTIVGALMNYFVLLHMYAEFMAGGMDGIVSLASKTIPVIKNPVSLVVLGISPFNIVKGIYIAVIGFYIYRLLRKALQES